MKRIKLFFYKSEPNFGDELNVYLLQRLFGIDAMYANKKHCDYVCIGSLLKSEYFEHKQNGDYEMMSIIRRFRKKK